jgi:hypothetical protein
MAMRNRAVAIVGLKILGDIVEIRGKLASAYRISDRAGIFSLRYLAENEIILGYTAPNLEQDRKSIQENLRLTRIGFCRAQQEYPALSA